MNNGRVLTLLGALGLIVGAFLPWASMNSIFGSFSRSGIEGDGIFSAGIGFILLLVALFAKGKAGKIYSWVVSFLALLALALILYVFNNVKDAVATAAQTFAASIESGIYISILGSVFGFIGGLLRVPETPPPATLPIPPADTPASPPNPPL
jgi:hypothetical protein